MKLFAVLIMGALSLNAFAADPAPNANLGFHHESEMGYIVVGGNAKSQSFSAKQMSSYQWDSDLLKLTAHYLSTQAQNQATKVVEGTAENMSAALREEHTFIPDTFNMFIQAGVNKDRFVGINLGNSYDLGVKYFWVSNDTIKLFSEVGYRYLKENLRQVVNGVSQDVDLESNFARLFTQLDYTHSPSMKFGVSVEYLPDVKHSDNYRFNFSPYALAILSETFSLKFGYEGQYRNTPVIGKTERLDYRHVTALIAKF